jgi:hypothetical protein
MRDESASVGQINISILILTISLIIIRWNILLHRITSKSSRNNAYDSSTLIRCSHTQHTTASTTSTSMPRALQYMMQPSSCYCSIFHRWHDGTTDNNNYKLTSKFQLHELCYNVRMEYFYNFITMMLLHSIYIQLITFY